MKDLSVKTAQKKKNQKNVSKYLSFLDFRMEKDSLGIRVKAESKRQSDIKYIKYILNT